MPGPFIHRIDPVITDICGVYLWWYGLSYTLGFLGIYLWFRRRRERLGFTLSEVYGLTLYLAVGVLLGGRLVEVVFYEWDYYSRHLLHIPAYWLGGMATHGLILGGTIGTLLFCWRRKKRFLTIADELAIPGAWVMGMGRIGNFIDGQISGAVTEVWWAVRFPDLEGFRHPVVLYDGLKNLLLIPGLLWIRRRKPPQGVLFAHFVFWYAFLRLFVDCFREYRVDTLGLGTGQIINIAMSILGLVLLMWFYRRGRHGTPVVLPLAGHADAANQTTLCLQRTLFLLILIVCLVIPSDWTQDVPARYGRRHPNMRTSWLYPQIAERAPGSVPQDDDGPLNHGRQPAP